MKYLLLASLVLTSLFSISQENSFSLNSDGRYELSSLYDSEISDKEILFQTLENWIHTYYKEYSDAKIHSIDKNNFTLASSPSTAVHYQLAGHQSPAGRVHYDLSLEILENGQVLFKMTNFDHESNRSALGSGGNLENEIPECGEEEMPSAYWLDIRKQVLSHGNLAMKDLANLLSGA